ncbi:FUSC family protein [Kriegella aquimaris]|uniref:Uncharacterized membrane protein YccC n=1 Tax=Kriegella aquimaris TaxID=192904 RepID=A0A1G9JMF7_9FLAO|nr:FUSC family membrane protein [Kriegella aquimaris]SDL38294.1 Uncharacterized membrane protein YccC [Kriegella aquimaris]
MKAFTQSVSDNFKDLVQFLKSTSFSKALLIGVAVTVPIALGVAFGHFEIGLALCFGAFWSSPSDVSGSYRHKKIGILFSAALVMVMTFIGGYLDLTAVILIPLLGLLSFAIAYLSVFGFRASLISFSGLLALVLSFAHDPQELEVYQYALLTGLGGLWYLLLTVIWHYINPRGQTEETLSETYVLTAEFLETRGKLVGPQADREKLQAHLHELQEKLTTNHETLRDILISSRKSSGRSIYQSKRLLIFAQLVEMLETAVANPVNYDKMDVLLKAHPEYIKSFQNLIFEMSAQLRTIARAGTNAKKLPKNSKLSACFKRVQTEILTFKENGGTQDIEDFLMLQNLFEYQEEQFEKLKKIKWLLGDAATENLEFVDRETAERFVAPQDYDPKVLLQNFSLKSTIFKHSLRLAVTVMIGYAVGTLFDFQNPYWILLTIIVILRPSYGLTKARSKDRVIGTLIGGAIASLIVLVVHNSYLLGVLGLGSLIIAFSMVQKNYKIGATFITLSVVFIYAIIRTDVLNVIQYRVFDTLLGATLAFLATLWLWPAWGFLEIKDSIQSGVAANKNFLDQIALYYKQKGKVPTAYKIARKEAFLETSNLSAALQRMVQEPKSKQKYLDEIYELVVLNHTFLSSLASLSTYIQGHTTTEASERFQAIIDRIEQNLDEMLDSFQHMENLSAMEEIGSENLFKEHLSSITKEDTGAADVFSKREQRSLQEAHLVWEQLQWLLALSAKMRKLTVQIKFD